MKQKWLILNLFIGFIVVTITYGCGGRKISKQTRVLADLHKPQ